jgi:hypothetical protein
VRGDNNWVQMTVEYSGVCKLLYDWQSLLGGCIGAMGAALAVYLTLTCQRREDRTRIRDAIIREVISFARLAIGHLKICNNIHTGRITLPVPKLAKMTQMPAPIIYPAVADKIGLLKAPQHVVAFYGRFEEIAIMAQAVSGDQNRQTSRIEANDVRLIVEVLLDSCRLAGSIIQDSAFGKEFDKAISADILSQIGETTTETRKNFPEQTED